MAHAHNTFLRALNSIYQSAPHVHTPTDIRDLLFYGTCWYSMVEHHHHFEETDFFPAVERIAGKPGLMQQNVGMLFLRLNPDCHVQTALFRSRCGPKILCSP